MFDATASKHREIQFQKIDGDTPDGQALMAQYGVRGFPMLVFLDASGKVLYNGGFPRQQEQLEQLIAQY